MSTIVEKNYGEQDKHNYGATDKYNYVRGNNILKSCQ